LSSQPLTYDLENHAAAALQPKAFYAGDQYQGQPTVTVNQDAVIIAGDAGNAINVSPDFGILLSGKISLSTMPDQISVGGGYWRFNPLLTACLPSTTPTPIPVFVKSTPLLLRSGDAISGAHSFLMSNSDLSTSTPDLSGIGL
jgi:hypothetical protein